MAEHVGIWDNEMADTGANYAATRMQNKLEVIIYYKIQSMMKLPKSLSVFTRHKIASVPHYNNYAVELTPFRVMTGAGINSRANKP